MTNTSLLIFDGDDTLWVTEILYDVARDAAAEVVRVAGFDHIAWAAAERTIDVDNVKIFGHSPERFPTSCVQALSAIVGPQGEEYIDPALVEDVWGAAAEVFDRPAELIEGAEDVLAGLSVDYELALLTKGDRGVQEKRIADSGLARWFDRIDITDHKSEATFRGLAIATGYDPGECWSIGNSLRSDIVPACAAGMRAVWIDAHVWEYERANSDAEQMPTRAVVAERLRDVPDVIARTEGRG